MRCWFRYSNYSGWRRWLFMKRCWHCRWCRTFLMINRCTNCTLVKSVSQSSIHLIYYTNTLSVSFFVCWKSLLIVDRPNCVYFCVNERRFAFEINLLADSYERLPVVGTTPCNTLIDLFSFSFWILLYWLFTFCLINSRFFSFSL